MTLLRLTDVSGVTVDARAAKIIRKERREASARLHASGETELEPTDRHDSKELCEDYYDYLLGQNGTCECANTTATGDIQQTNLMSMTDCSEAAEPAGISAPHNFKLTDTEWFNRRPQGCYMAECTSNSKGWCYYYNPILDQPHKCKGTTMPDGSTPDIEGRPVCKRRKYVLGTQDTNGGCPYQYGIVHDETNCTHIASCLGYNVGSEFRVTATNASRYHDYPVGCFINNGKPNGIQGDGKVYYNPPLPMHGNTLPSNPKGINICNVTVRNFISDAHWNDGNGEANNVEGDAAPTPTPAPATM